MKHKILYIIAAAAAVIATAACNKEKPEDFDPSVLDIKVQPDSLVVKADGGNASFTFNAPDYWFASSPADWVEFEPASGKPGEVTLVVKVPEYHVAQQRSALVTVNAKGHKGQFKVIQEAGVPLPPPPDYSGPWTVIGTIDGSNWDKDFDMSDKGDLVWEAKIPYKEGDEFKFRMNAAWDTNMGIDGDLAGADGSYTCSLKQDGPNIKLPAEGYWNLTLNMNDLTMAAVFDSEFPSDLDVEGTVIWDEQTAFSSWSATLVIPAEKFANANAGDIIRVYISGKGGDYNPIFKHVEDWSDWNELQGGKVDEDTYFEAPIPEEALNELKEKGLRFQGVGFTIDAVTLISGAPEGTVIWNEQTAFSSWSATIVIPAEKFADANVGDIIRVYISDKGGDYNPIFKHVEDWSDWNELQGGKVDADTYFEAPIPEEALNELKEKGLRFQGVGFTIDAVVIIVPGSQVIWENDGSHGDAAWGGTYRYGLDGHDSKYECIATFPQDVWDKLKSQTFYVKISGSNPQVRITDGWWTVNLTAADIQPGNELLADNGDGTWTITVNLSGATDLLALLDDRHLLFTGGGFAVESIYF